MTSILVIGTATAEVVTNERNKRHCRLGGIAAVVTQELRRGGHQPLLHTALADDDAGLATRQALTKSGLRWEHSPMARYRRSPFCSTTVKNGAPTKSVGHFPMLGESDFDVPYLEILAEEHDWVILDARIQPDVMWRIARNSRHLAVVATERQFNPSLTKAIRQLPKAFFACNEREARLICGNITSIHGIRQRANSDAALLTYGRQGWKFQSANCGDHSPNPTPPHEADFIDAEATAAAGAIHAIVTGEPLKQSVNAYLAGRLQFTSGLHTRARLPALSALTAA